MKPQIAEKRKAALAARPQAPRPKRKLPDLPALRVIADDVMGGYGSFPGQYQRNDYHLIQTRQ
jgi:hypothetical protein